MMDINLGFYLLIFVLKLIEHATFAARMTFLTSGQKKIASFLVFPEVTAWVIGTGTVAVRVFDEPLLMIPFLAGGLIGMYLGMVIQDLLSIRDTVILGITHEEFCHYTANDLRENNFGVTILESEDNTKVLVIATRKNRTSKAKKILKKYNNSASIITSPASRTIGGYVY